MNRGFVAAVGGAAVVAAALAGCSSSDKKDSTESSTSSAAESPSETTAASGTAAAGSGPAKVVIDGKDQGVSGTIACAPTPDGKFSIAIGDAGTGVGIVTEGEPPVVNSVGLGSVGGIVLGFQKDAGQGNAEATKDGNTWKITGNATGIDTANPLQPVTKPFEIEVTCP